MATLFYIKEAGIDDIGHLAELGEKTFRETFAEQNTKEDMDLYTRKAYKLENIREELMNALATFYIAWYAHQPVGYVKMRRSDNPKEIHDDASIEIERIYVLKEFQGKEIGRHLLEKCIHYAQAKMWDSIWLAVWEKNLKAIEFYKHFGFAFFGTRTFILGSDRQNDLMMIKKLK